jgi:hypothetical protein
MMTSAHHPQSPRTKGIVLTLVREVKKHTEGIDADLHVTNEKISVLEATQLATDTKLGTMEASHQMRKYMFGVTCPGVLLLNPYRSHSSKKNSVSTFCAADSPECTT